jgi:aryl-alcohol dehydrogenase-like predicted oxidoreductase
MNRDLDVFEQLRQEAKIRFIGASIKGANVTQNTVDLCRQYIDTGRLDVIQMIYSIFRQKTRDIFQEARAKNVGLVGRTSLESGFLTGKYEPGHEFTGTDHRKRWNRERLRKILECAQRLKKTAVNPPYESLAQVAIRFAMLPDAIASTIVGAKSADQVQANLRALDLPPLDQTLVDRLITEYGDLTEEFNG